MIATVNPATGETLRTFEPLTEDQIEDKITRADCAFRSYRRTSLADRARWLQRAAEILETERDRLGRIMTLEMGKPIAAARAEAAKCALACRYYVEQGERLLADEPVEAGAGTNGGQRGAPEARFQRAPVRVGHRRDHSPRRVPARCLPGAPDRLEPGG